MSLVGSVRVVPRFKNAHVSRLVGAFVVQVCALKEKTRGVQIFDYFANSVCYSIIFDAVLLFEVL